MFISTVEIAANKHAHTYKAMVVINRYGNRRYWVQTVGMLRLWRGNFLFIINAYLLVTHILLLILCTAVKIS